MPTLVLADANVLHSRTLRDWLLLLKDTSGGAMFQVAYTEDILAETLYWIRRKNPHLSGDQVTLVRDQLVETMDQRISEYPSGQDAEFIADPFDRHLHAAAQKARVDCVVTQDRGFTDMAQDVRDTLEYEIYTPDEFFVLVDDSSPSTVRATLRRQIDYRSQRADADYDFARALTGAGCPDFAQRIDARCRELALRRR